jgi:DNA polymerase-4
MDPLIFHVDMDAFFVSVEELFDPSLRGKAVAVGGDPSHRGVVAAASYEARKYGVHSAMPLASAKARCPHLIFLPGRRKAYSEYSDIIHKIFASFTPAVEMVSIDEAYLDFTGTQRLYGNSFPLAHRLRQCILEKTGLRDRKSVV